MTSYNGYPLAYDENGNLTQRQTAQGPVNYTWDARNRLSRIDGPNGSAAFKYDALGRRLEKTVNGRTTQYLYDGAQAIAELQGSAIGATYLTGLAIDEILARYSNGAERSQLTDALGSIIAQAKEDRSIQNHYAYSTWGETLAAGTDEDNPSQYTARENDQTGLYYYRARYYDPQLKRFVSEDPIGLEGGVNVYAYVDGDPVSYTDPEGLLLTGLHAFSQGMTTQQAAQAGGMGTTAAIAGGVAAATTGVAAVGGGGYLGLPANVRRAVTIAKATAKGALVKTPGLPPPQPPIPPLTTPPAITCPAPASSLGKGLPPITPTRPTPP
jgi:RHS repeat-associated protein